MSTTFEAIESDGATPVCEPVLRNVRDPGADRLARVAAAQPPSRRRAIAPARRRAHAGDRLGELALAVAGDARRSRRSRRRARSADAAQRVAAAVAGRPEVVDLEHRLAELAVALDARRAAISRPTISDASERGVASAVVDGRDRSCPPRSTVTRSETAFTSCSLCEMKMIVRPSSAITRSVSNSDVGLLRRQHRRRLVEDQDPRLAVERLQDLDALLLAERELPDARARVDGDPVALAELGDAALDRAAGAR